MSNKIQLPPPQKNLKFLLMEALDKRRSLRKWSNISIPTQELSNILWSACGITQQENSLNKQKRTVPSACNSQAVKIFIANQKGLFYYDEKFHQLIKLMSSDIRNYIGTQKMIRSAPVNLIFVSDYSKISTPIIKNDEQRQYISNIETGCICQNVYLYCTAANLNTVAFALINKELHQKMKLKECEKIILAQAIGKPPKE